MRTSTTAAIQVGRPVVLCVEDEPAQLLLLSRIFSDIGYAVLQASTPDHALELFAEAPVSLVVADHLLRGTTARSLPQD